MRETESNKDMFRYCTDSRRELMGHLDTAAMSTIKPARAAMGELFRNLPVINAISRVPEEERLVLYTENVEELKDLLPDEYQAWVVYRDEGRFRLEENMHKLEVGEK